MALSSANFLQAQWFEPEPISGDSLVFGNLDWGDYDQDGDQDLLTMGAIVGGDQKTVLYRNDGGSFTEVETPFLRAQNGSCNFFDYDNDNDLDVLVTGFSSAEGGAITRTYRNDGGIFTEIDLKLKNAMFSTVVFADVDKDGYQDILMTGWIEGAAPGEVLYYRNVVDSFALDTSFLFPALNFGALDVTDLDHDGNIDLIIAGSDDTWSQYTGHFEYDLAEKTFVEKETELEGISDAWVKFFDYNDDGYDDLLLYGLGNDYEKRLLIYENDGEDLNLVQSLDSLSSSTAKNPVITGDIDNDGDNDIIVGGVNEDWDYTMMAYLNHENVYAYSPEVGLPEWGSNTSLAFCDVDGDLDLDFSFTGRDNVTIDEVAVHLFKNEYAAVNTPPNAPELVNHVVEDSAVTLSWSRAVDNETRELGLTYNLGLYYSSESEWIIPPHALLSGERMVTKRGNMLQDTSIVFEDLDFGTYEWRIQTIDNSFVPSDFIVKTFEITDGPYASLTEEVIDPLVCAPVPFQNSFRLINTGSETINHIAIYDVAGKLVSSFDVLSSNAELNIATEEWQSGLYFVRFNVGNNVLNQKIMKN